MSRFAPGAKGPDSVSVTVHDGRSGRADDPPADAVLVRFQAATPFRVGDVLTLPDGTRCPVIDVRNKMSLSGSWSQVVIVGDPSG